MAAQPGTYTYGQIETLWVQNGGSASAAPMAAAIALAESSGDTSAYNGTAGPASSLLHWVGHSSTDESYGLWQTNYKGSLGPSRSARYGSPSELALSPDRQARSAIDISANGQDWSHWSTFTNGEYKKYLRNDTYIIPTDQGITPGALPSNPSTQGQPTDQLPAASLGTGEGDLFSNKFLGISIKRQTARKALGAVVLVGGGFIILVGVFRITGWKPKQVSAEQLNRPLLVPVSEPEPAEPPTTDELAERRRQRSRARRTQSAENETRSARAAGERAAAEAGDF